MSNSNRAWFLMLVALMLVIAACSKTSEDGGADPTAASTTPAAQTPDDGGTTGTDPAPTAPSAEKTTTTTVAEPIELVIWADEDRAAVLAEAAVEFEDATGIAVGIEIVEFGQIKDKVLSSGSDGEGPDIFIGAHAWTGELVAAAAVQPIDLRGEADDYLQVALDAFSLAGSLYAMPYAAEAVAMYYNVDLVEQAPATFEEIAEICSGLSDIDNCLGLPGGGKVADAYHNFVFISTLGGHIFAYDPTTGYEVGDIGLTNNGAIAGLDFLADQIEAGVIGSVDYQQAKNLFLEGRQPFWVTGPWELGTLDDSALDWSVAPLPTIDGQAQSPFVGAQGFFVSAFSEKAVIAQSFLFDFVATTDTMQALQDADPRVPAWRSVLEGLSDDPATQAFARSVTDGRPIPNIPEMTAVWDPLGKYLLAIRNAELTPRDAMEAAQADIETALAD